MNRTKLILLSLLASLVMAHCYGEYCSSTDRFYRYSNKKGHFDAVHTGFFTEEELYKKSKIEAKTTYTGTSIPPGINDGYNGTPSGRYKEGNISSAADLLKVEDTGTYQGTSIPPGINDGYNGTPDGRYKNSGLFFSTDVNKSNARTQGGASGKK